VWLFGSRAAGCARSASDWDLLVLTPNRGHRGRERVAAFDIVTISWDGNAYDGWLGSELAAHAARYGELLFGRDDWTGRVDAEAARCRKNAIVRGRIAAVMRAWQSLDARYRSKWALSLRRDVQRVLALADSRTVPPTLFLDQQWAAHTNRERTSLLARVDAPLGCELGRAMGQALAREPAPVSLF
jgi:hypothetical protein